MSICLLIPPWTCQAKVLVLRLSLLVSVLTKERTGQSQSQREKADCSSFPLHPEITGLPHWLGWSGLESRTEADTDLTSQRKITESKPIMKTPSEKHWLVEASLWRVENRSVHTLPYEKATGISEHQTRTKFRQKITITLQNEDQIFIRQDNISNTRTIIPPSDLISFQYFKFKAKLCTAQ